MQNIKPLIAFFVGLAPCAFSNCFTLTYGGENGDPGDTGAYLSTFNNTYRLDGNTVWMYTNSSVSGPNANLVRPTVKGYFYRNGGLLTTISNTAATNGATAVAQTGQTLYTGGQYYLGTFRVGDPSANQNEHSAVSPTCVSQGFNPLFNTFFDYSNTYTAVKPTIVPPNCPGPSCFSNLRLWFLGGAASIDGYYVSSPIYGHTGWGNDQTPIQWTITQGDDKVDLSSTTVYNPTVTSTAPSGSSPGGGYIDDIYFQISTDGLPSDAFPASVNAPVYVTRTALGPDSISNGWQYGFAYRIYDLVGNSIGAYPLTTHETFENRKLLSPFVSSPDTDPNYSNWLGFSIAQTTWSAANWAGGEFADYVYAQDTTPSSLVPVPVTFSIPPKAVMDISQKFFAGEGSGGSFNGQCVYKGKLVYYNDHGEAITASTPPDDCSQGEFGNP